MSACKIEISLQTNISGSELKQRVEKISVPKQASFSRKDETSGLRFSSDKPSHSFKIKDPSLT